MPPDPTRAGYLFRLWDTKADASGAAFNSNTPVNGDIDVYAVWVPNPPSNKYMLNYNDNGGTGDIEPEYGEAGASTTLSDGTGLEREGYKFVGWNTKANYSGKYYAGEASWTFPEANTNLYAVWSGDGSDETHAIAITKDSELSALYDPDKNFILANDITYDGPPLGDSANPYYNGVFNGSGHTIQVHINGVVILEGFAVCGLFPQVRYDGVVKNLRIINERSDNPQGVHADFSNSGVSQAYAGVVTGVNFGTITNIICEAFLTCGPMTGSGSEPEGINAGGIAGWNAISSMYGKTNYVYTRGDVDSSDGSDVNIGGVFGKCAYSIDHIVALNEHLMNGGANESNGRISGSADSVIGCSKLYANSAMTADGSTMSGGDSDTDAETGADVSATQFNTKDWWTDTAGWTFNDSDASSVWAWDEDAKLPVFAQ